MASANARPPAAPARILLVEDNPINQFALQKMLEREGFCVAAANNGREALELLAGDTFNLVLMDIQMPEMDGLEALRCIRTGACGVRDPRVPIIAMTAYAMYGDRESFLAAGMDGYLPKPIRYDDLRQLIVSYCGLPSLSPL